VTWVPVGAVVAFAAFCFSSCGGGESSGSSETPSNQGSQAMQQSSGIEGEADPSEVSGDNCATVHCGACPSAIQVLLIDPDTEREIGWDAVVPAAEIVGVEGECNSFGQCDIIASSEDPNHVYQFDVVFRGEVVANISATAETESVLAECCNCGYATRVILVEVDV
jgi:hypothetical protein